MLKNLLLATTCLMSLTLSAQTADEILEKVKTKFFENPITELRFTQSIDIAEADVHRKQHGTLTYSNDNKFVLVLDEMAQKIYVDGTTQWSVSDEDEEIQVSEVDKDDEEGFSFSKYFEDYKSKFEASVMPSGSLIELRPKDENAEIQKVELNFDPKTFALIGFTETSANGTTQSVVIDSVKTLEAFSFEPDMTQFEDYEVLDLR
ncbi:MAG: LolA family protein [Flavobacteriales bacterium]